MIERLRITDFQKHVDLKIKLDRVTVITGPSDVGKSSVLRALCWLMTNRPRGKAFVRDGCDSVTVRAWIDGVKVVRQRDSGNRYFLDEQCYEAVGGDIPQPVSDLLKVSDLNFQGQHDSPFWLGLSPSEVARRLNDIVDLGVIDRVHSFLAKRLRSSQAVKGVVESRIVEAEQELESLGFVDELGVEVEQLEGLDQKLAERRDELSDFREALEEAEHWTGILKGLEVPDVDPLVEQISGLEELRLEVLCLRGAWERARDLSAQIKELGNEIAKLESQITRCPTCGQPWQK